MDKQSEVFQDKIDFSSNSFSYRNNKSICLPGDLITKQKIGIEKF
jgi:hypothetical protein